jgi:hypothetical protein
MPVCPVEKNGFCPRHQTIHAGPRLAIALDPEAEHIRAMWDYNRFRMRERTKEKACVYRGEPTGDLVPCAEGCRGVQLKTFACEKFGVCTIQKRGVNVNGCCHGCEHQQTERPVRERTWAYGVTTIQKRRSDLLPQTLASLKAAGFDKPRLFVDGETDGQSWQREFGLEITTHSPALKVHGNWILSLYELYLRAPDAERFALFQDDLLCCSNLRKYLDSCEYPDGPVNAKQSPGYWNLYTAPSNQQLAKREGFYESNQCGKGALALVFSRQAVITLLSAEHMVQRPQDKERGWRAVDGGIVDSMRKAGWKEYVHNPSLVLHTGVVCSFDKRRASSGLDDKYPPYVWPDHYKATSFRGEAWDAMEMMK